MPSIPLYILHGQLGAGKTTILTELLNRPEFSDPYIVENEFAGHSVDGNRLTHDHPHVRIYELSGTCVCCTGSDALMDTLLQLGDEANGQRPIIVETTGAADAARLMKSLLLDPVFHQRFVLKANILVIDALCAHHEPHFLDSLQADMTLADAVILTKTDLLASEDMDRVLTNIRLQREDVLVANHGKLPNTVEFTNESSLALDGLVALADVIDEKEHEVTEWKTMMLPSCTTEQLVEAIVKARANGAIISRVKGTINDPKGSTWRVDGTEYMSECSRVEPSTKDPLLVLIGKHLPDSLDL